ncbi:MAG: hypothetical protein RSC92_00900 [Clostridia bacterium]
MKSNVLAALMIEKYPNHYQKTSTNKKIKNLLGISTDEFIEHIKTIYPNIDINIITHKRSEGGISDTFPTVIYQNEKICLTGKKMSKSIGSDVIIKEGLVCYFYTTKIKYNLDDFSGFKATLKSLNTILNDINENAFECISNEDLLYIKSVIIQYINLNETDLCKRMKNILNAFSIADNLRKSYYKKDGWRVDKNVLFKHIKQQGSKLSNLRTDKWNPMDIMLYKSNSKSIIQKTYNTLNDINNIFVNDIFNPTKDEYVLGISLKEENAQYGKGKGYLNIIKNKFELGEYNLNTEELNYIKNNYTSKIMKFLIIYKKVKNIIHQHYTI